MPRKETPDGAKRSPGRRSLFNLHNCGHFLFADSCFGVAHATFDRTVRREVMGDIFHDVASFRHLSVYGDSAGLVEPRF